MVNATQYLIKCWQRHYLLEEVSLHVNELFDGLWRHSVAHQCREGHLCCCLSSPFMLLLLWRRHLRENGGWRNGAAGTVKLATGRGRHVLLLLLLLLLPVRSVAHVLGHRLDGLVNATTSTATWTVARSLL